MAIELREENPYVGPRPFEERERERFFGRDWEADELVSLVVAHPAVLLYAQSGAGKTSLIKARVVPLLKDEEGFEVLPVVRVGGELPEGVKPDQIANLFIFNTLMSWMEVGINPARVVDLSLLDFLKRLPQATDEEGQPVLRIIIFDQFEELFTFYPERWAERRGFFAQVGEALSGDPFLRVLFVMREEYLAQLDPYVALLPERLRARFRLERLRKEAALAAVKGPLRDTKRSFAPGVAESLVEELLKIKVETRVGQTIEAPGEFVEPVQLQVVCRSLWEELPPEVTEITQRHLRTFGDVDRALSEFYERALKIAVQQTRVKEGKLRAWFEQNLITPMGTRGTVYRGAESTGGVPNSAIEVLERQHLIRAERRAGARWYELTHDRFIEPIRASNEAWRAARRQRRLRIIAGGVGAAVTVAVLGLSLLLWRQGEYSWEAGRISGEVIAAATATHVARLSEATASYVAQQAQATATAAAAQVSGVAVEFLRSGVRPLRSGASVGGVRGTAGTIGCFVRNGNGDIYLLSAADVLGGPDYKLGTAVTQPGPIDGGQEPDDVVGYFVKYLPLADGASVANLAGLARLKEGIEFETIIPGIGPIQGIRDPRVGMSVRKLGRTTGLTTGQITAIGQELSISLPWAMGEERSLRLRDCIVCSLMSASGDGGALVVDEEGYAIGIVVAASQSRTILAPIQEVLDSLDVQLIAR